MRTREMIRSLRNGRGEIPMAFVRFITIPNIRCSTKRGFHVKDMVRRAAECQCPQSPSPIAGVMSGVPELCDACDAVEARGVKPFYGCEVYFTG